MVSVMWGLLTKVTLVCSQETVQQGASE